MVQYGTNRLKYDAVWRGITEDHTAPYCTILRLTLKGSMMKYQRVPTSRAVTILELTVSS